MKALLLFICLLLLSSCASTPQSRQLRTNGVSSLPSQFELSDTPFYPQTQYQCGPAALATVLQTHGINSTPEKLATQVYIPERKGSLQIEMTAASRRHATLPYPLAPRLVDLFTEIAAGNPVLVLQNLGLDWYPQWHYAVAVGYDTDNQEIVLRSGTTKRRISSFEVFERTWKRADFWALVIVPMGEIPATAEPARYLKTAYAFEETGHPAMAVKAYRAASRQWPEVAATWMALGNMAFANQDWRMAVSAFNTAARLQPDSLSSWNNLAYALHADGCKTQAEIALQCALKISPDDKNLQDSWSELIDGTVSHDRSKCPLIRCQ